MALMALIVIGVVWILQIESDDRPPIIAMGLVATLICITVATAANVFQKKLQHSS
jgi:hypothetical protein